MNHIICILSPFQASRLSPALQLLGLPRRVWYNCSVSSLSFSVYPVPILLTCCPGIASYPLHTLTLSWYYWSFCQYIIYVHASQLRPASPTIGVNPALGMSLLNATQFHNQLIGKFVAQVISVHHVSPHEAPVPPRGDSGVTFHLFHKHMGHIDVTLLEGAVSHPAGLCIQEGTPNCFVVHPKMWNHSVLVA